MLNLFLLVFLFFVQGVSAKKYSTDPKIVDSFSQCNITAPCGCPRRPMSGTKIIDGTPAAKGSWPWTVSIRNASDFSFCGGTILNEWYVITAAHCFPKSFKIMPDFFICAGTNRLNVTCRQRRKVQKINNHMSYSSNNFVNDISLLEVDVPFNFTDKSIARICLPDSTRGSQYPEPGTDVVAVGWGRTRTASRSDTLQQVIFQIIAESENNCDDSVWYDHRIKLCAVASGKDACDGDSGGPLMYFSASKRYELIGITSYGLGCANDYPGVYTRITAFLTWIHEFLKIKPLRFTGTYQLVLDASDKVLEVYGARTRKGANVQLHRNNGGENQRWIIHQNNDDTIKLINLKSGKVLDVARGKTSDGTNVQIYTDNGSNAQKWQLKKVGEGIYKLINPISGKALDVKDGVIADGTNVQIWSETDGVGQKWRLVQYNHKGIWTLIATDHAASKCPYIEHGDSSSLTACQASCDASEKCNVINYRPEPENDCVLRQCSTYPPATESAPKYVVWGRKSVAN